MPFRCATRSIDSGLTGPAARERQQMARQAGAAGDRAAHGIEHALALRWP